jgi:hypothetical protein
LNPSRSSNFQNTAFAKLERSNKSYQILLWRQHFDLAFEASKAKEGNRSDLSFEEPMNVGKVSLFLYAKLTIE